MILHVLPPQTQKAVSEGGYLSKFSVSVRQRTGRSFPVPETPSITVTRWVIGEALLSHFWSLAHTQSLLAGPAVPNNLMHRLIGLAEKDYAALWSSKAKEGSLLSLRGTYHAPKRHRLEMRPRMEQLRSGFRRGSHPGREGAQGSLAEKRFSGSKIIIQPGGRGFLDPSFPWPPTKL